MDMIAGNQTLHAAGNGNFEKRFVF